MINWNDKNEVLEAVKQNGLDLKYAHESLKQDKEVVLTAVKQNKESFQYADCMFMLDTDIELARGNKS